MQEILNRPVQPENDLHPDPAWLALEIQTIKARLDIIEDAIECLTQLNKPQVERLVLLAQRSKT